MVARDSLLLFPVHSSNITLSHSFSHAQATNQSLYSNRLTKSFQFSFEIFFPLLFHWLILYIPDSSLLFVRFWVFFSLLPQPLLLLLLLSVCLFLMRSFSYFSISCWCDQYCNAFILNACFVLYFKDFVKWWRKYGIDGYSRL